ITAGNNFTKKSWLNIFQQIIDRLLLLYCLRTLFALVLLINASSLSSPVINTSLIYANATISKASESLIINIGLIYSNATIPKAPDFLQAGINDVIDAQSLHDYQFRLLPVPSLGCFGGKQKGNDAAIIAQMYHENDLQVLFGPTCDSDLNIVGRLTNEWNILHFSFGSEHFDNFHNSAVQVAVVLYTQLYESGWLYSTLLRNTFQVSQNFTELKRFESLIDKLKSSHFTGPFGSIWLNQYTVRLTPFQVKYVEVFEKEPIIIAELFLTEKCELTREENANKRCISLTGKIINYNTTVTKNIPVDMPSCGFKGELCDYTRGILKIVLMIMAIVLVLCVFIVYQKS
ncbi:unnamed protein product, partial [Acanthocheilonema viteae]